MDTLAQIYARHSGPGKFNDKGTTHDYITGVYEALLSPYRMTAKRFLELGIFDGWSLRMWEAYWGPQCEVHGVDCCEQPHGGAADLRPMIAEGTHNIHIFDATCAGVDAEILDKPENWFDVIIEDCSHDLDQQLQLWSVWSRRLAPGGLYIIEDLQTKTAIEHFAAREFEIRDRTKIKNRYDDVLAIYRKPS